MIHVIIGIGAAGITVAKTIRSISRSDEIIMIAPEEQPHSRCMLHKYLSHERDAEGINFVSDTFFEDYRITLVSGCRVISVDTTDKKVFCSGARYYSYDKLLIASGAESFIPPVGELRTASNVFGLRHLKDAKAIDEKAAKSNKVVIIGSGLVGLDAAYGLLKQGKEITVVEMAERILPVQLDEKGAKEYQRRFERAGVRFCLGRKGTDTVCNERGEVIQIVLDNNEKLDCDLVIAAAGVRCATEAFEDCGIRIERGIQVDEYMNTSQADIYAAGDVTGLSGIWPNAMKQGKTAGENMVKGNQRVYDDSFAAKNTINFFGLVSLCVGELTAQESDEVVVQESAFQYSRAIFRDNRLAGCLLQGDISHGGIYQYLIKNRIDLTGKKDKIFSMNFGEFYGIKENGEYFWNIS